jgi:hypothetical protein
VLSRASTSRRRCSIEPPPSQKRGILINCTHMVRSGISFDPPPGPCALLQLEAAAADGFSTTVFHVQKQQHDRRWLSPRRPHRSSHVLYAARRSRVKPAMSDGVARRVRTQLDRLPQYVQLRGGLLGSATCRRRQRPSSSATALVRTPPAVKRAAHVRPRRRRCLGTAPLCRRRVPSTRACRRDEERASSQVALARRRLWSPLFFCRTIMEPAAVACLQPIELWTTDSYFSNQSLRAPLKNAVLSMLSCPTSSPLPPRPSSRRFYFWLCYSSLSTTIWSNTR